MPLTRSPVEVVLAGLDQKTTAKLTTPGRLTTAENVEFDKVGALNKRAGYRMFERVQVDGAVMPSVMVRLAVDHGELVAMGCEEAFAAVDVGEGLQATDRGMVSRGAISYGAVSVMDVVTGIDTEGP